MIEPSSAVFRQYRKDERLEASLTISKKETCINPIVLLHHVHVKDHCTMSDKQSLSPFTFNKSNMAMRCTSPKVTTCPFEVPSDKTKPSIQSSSFTTCSWSQGKSSKSPPMFNSVQRSHSELEQITKSNLLNILKLQPVANQDHLSRNATEQYKTNSIQQSVSKHVHRKETRSLTRDRLSTNATEQYKSTSIQQSVSKHIRRKETKSSIRDHLSTNATEQYKSTSIQQSVSKHKHRKETKSSIRDHLSTNATEQYKSTSIQQSVSKHIDRKETKSSTLSYSNKHLFFHVNQSGIHSSCKLGYAGENHSSGMNKHCTAKCSYENRKLGVRKSLLTVPISSPLGQIFLKRKNLFSYFDNNLKRRNLADGEKIRNSDRMSKSKTIDCFPIVFRGYRRKKDEAYFHKYNFTKMQKTDFHHRLRTGLDFKSRTLLKTMKHCHVLLHRLTDSDFHVWMPSHKQMVVKKKHCHVLLQRIDSVKYTMGHSRLKEKLNDNSLHGSKTAVHSTKYTVDSAVSFTGGQNLYQQQQKPTTRIVSKLPHASILDFRHTLSNSNTEKTHRVVQDSGASITERQNLKHQQHQRPTTRIASKLPHASILDFRHALSNSNTEKTPMVGQDSEVTFTEGQNSERQQQQKPTTRMSSKLPHSSVLDFRHALSNSNTETTHMVGQDSEVSFTEGQNSERQQHQRPTTRIASKLLHAPILDFRHALSNSNTETTHMVRQDSEVSFTEGQNSEPQQRKPTTRIASKLPCAPILDFRHTLSTSYTENTPRVGQDSEVSFTEGQNSERQQHQTPRRIVTKLPHATILDFGHILSNSSTENTPKYHSSRKTINAPLNCNAPGVKKQAKNIHDNDQTRTVGKRRRCLSKARITRFSRKFKATTIRVADEGKPIVQLPLQEPFWFIPINQGKRHTYFPIPCSQHSLFL